MIVGGSKCAMADKDCRPPLQWHHAVKQQRLKREFKYGARWSTGHSRFVPAGRNEAARDEHDYGAKTLDVILGDTRNRVWLCQAHHERVTNGRLKVPLPESVYAFADEFGLRAQLENDIARAA